MNYEYTDSDATVVYLDSEGFLSYDIAKKIVSDIESVLPMYESCTELEEDDIKVYHIRAHPDAVKEDELSKPLYRIVLDKKWIIVSQCIYDSFWYYHITTFDDLRYNPPRIEGGLDEPYKIIVGRWYHPVKFCSMEPCSMCECFMDCTRGGYRK